MDENTQTQSWTVTLADGTAIDGLTLSGNNFIAGTEITADMFDGNLNEVHITASGEIAEPSPYPAVLHDAALVQILRPADTPDGKWWFILRELSPDELFRAKVQAQLDYLAMTTDTDLEDM